MTNQDELSRDEIELQTTAQVKELMHGLTETAIANVTKAIASGSHPASWNKNEDYRLAKAIVDSLCVDRPYQPKDKQTKKDFDNVRLFL